MSDGIRIEDAAIEITPEALEGLLGGSGTTEVRVSRVSITVSEESLNAVLRGTAPEGASGSTPAVDPSAPAAKPAPPTVRIQAEGVSVDLNRGGRQMRLGLNFGSVRVQFTDGAVRVTTE